MSFLGALGSVGSAVNAFGGIKNGIKGIFGIDNQDEKTKKLMEYQAELNKKAAEHTNQLNKEMWDYTNYENQVKHLKQAGLNPGLLYGMSGGGGTSAAGGQDAGASGAGASQEGMLGLQAQQIAAQTNLANAEAEKARADAKKTSGADTELTNALTELNKAKKQTEITTQALQKAQENVEWVKQNEVAASAQNLWNAAQNYLELTRKNRVEANIEENAQNDLIEAIKLKNLEIWSNIILNDEKVKTNKAEQGKMYAEVQRVMNEKEYWDMLVEIGKDANNIKRAGVIQKGQEIYQLSRKVDSFQDYISRKVKNMSQDNVRAWIRSATDIVDCFGENAEKIISIIKKGGMTGSSRQTGRKVKYDKEGKIESYEDIWSSIW